MTAKMDNSFINFVDFIVVTLEAYDVTPRKLLKKMMRMIMSTFQTHKTKFLKNIESVKFPELRLANKFKSDLYLVLLSRVRRFVRCLMVQVT